MKRSTAVVLIALLVLPAAGCAPYPGGGDVPFLVTPPEIVDRMLRLARVGPGDIVYDLGSGDGRLVIAAVRDFAARLTSLGGPAVDDTIEVTVRCEPAVADRTP